MSSYIIEGGHKLEGIVKISGSKNSALPIIAATILNAGKTTLYNVPNIQDTQMMYKILETLGAKIEKKNGKIKIDTSKIEKFEIPPELMHKMRSSVILAGALIGRYQKATFSYPGGCDIGSRPIDLHLKSFEKLGIQVNQNHGNIECNAEKIKGEKIDLDFPSVGATENAILASILAEGTTIITNAAREPEIIDLQNFLNKMGAKIVGAGTDEIQIEGVKKLKAIDIKTMPYPGFPTDMQSVFASMLTIAKGTSIIVENIFENRYKYTQELNKMGAKITVEGKSAIIRGTRKLYGADVKATDLRGGAALVLAGLIAKGKTQVDDIEYILRGYEKLDYKLQNLGANINIE